MKPTETTERRQNKRKIVKFGLIALLQTNKPIRFGDVIDISHSGLSFILDKDKYNSDIKDPMKMDIFLIHDNIFLEHVTTSVISEKIWKNDPVNKHHSTCRYGVKFEKLDSIKAKQLKKLTSDVY